MNSLLTKTFTAGGAIEPRRFVKFGAADGVVVQAAGPTDAIIGVSSRAGPVAIGGRVDVEMLGSAEVQAGGNLTRGALVTSDANGKAVAAAPAAGVNNRTGGAALSSAVADDFINVLLAPAQIQGA